MTRSDQRFGGPNLLQLSNGSWLAGSRGYRAKAATDLWWLDMETGQFHDLLTLPSAGDASYPGFVVDQPADRLLVPYYSSHEGKSAIHLATPWLGALQSRE